MNSLASGATSTVAQATNRIKHVFQPFTKSAHLNAKARLYGQVEKLLGEITCISHNCTGKNRWFQRCGGALQLLT